MMHRTAENMDKFVARNQIESVEESIAAPSWKKTSQISLIIERIAAIIHR